MLKLEARPEASKFWSTASPVLALFLTVLVGVVMFMALGIGPLRGLHVLFWEPVKSAYALGVRLVGGEGARGGGKGARGPGRAWG